MPLIPRFQRDQISVEEAFEVASAKVTGSSQKEIQKQFPEFQKSELKSQEVQQAESCLLTEIRRLAKDNLHDHLTVLEQIRNEARRDGVYSAAVSAEKSRGQVFGFYDPARIQKSEEPSSLEDLSVSELTSLLNKLDNPDGKE